MNEKYSELYEEFSDLKNKVNANFKMGNVKRNGVMDTPEVFVTADDMLRLAEIARELKSTGRETLELNQTQWHEIILYAGEWS